MPSESEDRDRGYRRDLPLEHQRPKGIGGVGHGQDVEKDRMTSGTDWSGHQMPQRMI